MFVVEELKRSGQQPLEVHDMIRPEITERKRDYLFFFFGVTFNLYWQCGAMFCQA